MSNFKVGDKVVFPSWLRSNSGEYTVSAVAQKIYLEEKGDDEWYDGCSLSLAPTTEEKMDCLSEEIRVLEGALALLTEEWANED